MQNPTKALMVGIIAGILLISFVASLTFNYTATRNVSAMIVNDDSANIALVPNDNNLKYTTAGASPQPFVEEVSGNLEVQFGNVAPNSNEILDNAFYVVNNLNTPVTVTITASSTSNGATLYLHSPDQTQKSYWSSTITFTLAAGAEEAISLELITSSSSTPGSGASFTITVQAQGPAPAPSG
ncbi:DUF1102 domain-containing protein [Saccharolobus shibatae]|uniref:DUF1102 domain-containing protein n=1 Tax=Saccharolobus shibatae TaxID=2286 RepID=A0A8F5GVJ2_9CREN|nr:DUF1102 domain-containing protein [Saccharolobus shibatae]QXJ31006.1 hypothetical protein J5U21_00655 [Saccharolobus shibatae]